MTTQTDSLPLLNPGQLLARGVCRHLRSHDFVGMTEFVPNRGLRVDVMAIGPKGQIWIIECKSSRADFTSDNKWHNYLPFCDQFFWAVAQDFPAELLPPDTGLIIADAWDAALLRHGPVQALPGARRKMLTQKFARNAAERLLGLTDPRPATTYAP